VAVEKGIKAAILVNFCASTNEYSTTYERTLIAETPEKNPSTATPDYNSLGVSTLEHSHDAGAVRRLQVKRKLRLKGD
jgi:hypothetical protein